MTTWAESRVGQVPKHAKGKANERLFVGRLLECLRTGTEPSVDKLSTQIQLEKLLDYVSNLTRFSQTNFNPAAE